MFRWSVLAIAVILALQGAIVPVGAHEVSSGIVHNHSATDSFLQYTVYLDSGCTRPAMNESHSYQVQGACQGVKTTWWGTHSVSDVTCNATNSKATMYTRIVGNTMMANDNCTVGNVTDGYQKMDVLTPVPTTCDLIAATNNTATMRWVKVSCVNGQGAVVTTPGPSTSTPQPTPQTNAGSSRVDGRWKTGAIAWTLAIVGAVASKYQ